MSTTHLPASRHPVDGHRAGETGASRARSRRRTRLLVTAAFVSALVLAAACTDEAEPELVEDAKDATAATDAPADTTTQPPPTEAPPAQDPASGTFGIGDLVEVVDWQVRVHGLTDPLENAIPVISPAEGSRWVAVDVEVTNIGDAPQPVSSLICFELGDDLNRVYDLAFTAEDVPMPPDGDVAPGGSLRGTLTYEVPNDAAGLRLTFRCDMFLSESVTIALS